MARVALIKIPGRLIHLCDLHNVKLSRGHTVLEIWLWSVGGATRHENSLFDRMVLVLVQYLMRCAQESLARCFLQFVPIVL